MVFNTFRPTRERFADLVCYCEESDLAVVAEQRYSQSRSIIEMVEIPATDHANNEEVAVCAERRKSPGKGAESQGR